VLQDSSGYIFILSFLFPSFDFLYSELSFYFLFLLYSYWVAYGCTIIGPVFVNIGCGVHISTGSGTKPMISGSIELLASPLHTHIFCEEKNIQFIPL